MKTTEINDLGAIKVSHTAVNQVVYKAVSECFGVLGMPPLNMTQFLKFDSSSRGLEVKIDEDGAAITLRIDVLYGTKLQEIARNITDAVTYSLDYAMGLKVKSLDIKITGIVIVE